MQSTDRTSADLIIIGGGIIGLATAFRAAMAGATVVVLDRAAIGSGATHVAAGMLSPALEAEDAEPCLIDFARQSVRRYPSFVAEVEAASGLSAGLRSEGGLWLALDRDDELLLERMHAIQERAGVATELLTADAAKSLEPNASVRTIAGLLSHDEMQADPRRLAQALADAVQRTRGTIVEHAAGIRITTNGDRVTGATWVDGAAAAPLVLIAAGCHTNDVLPVECTPLPLRPVKGQTVRLRGSPVIGRVVRTPRVYLVPRSDGEIVVGATVEEQGFDRRPTVWAVHDLLAEARRAVPAVDELEISELTVGFRPTLRDHLPAIGAYGPSGLFVATGHYRHGVLLAVATADTLTALFTGDSHAQRLNPFDPHRFACTRGHDRDHLERPGEDRLRSPAH